MLDSIYHNTLKITVPSFKKISLLCNNVTVLRYMREVKSLVS